MQNRELELQLEAISRRLECAESEIEQLKNPPDRLWLSPVEVETQSGGKYPSRLVKDIIQRSIDRPADYPFKLGTHYTVNKGEKRRTILINYLEFDRLMIVRMRELAFV